MGSQLQLYTEDQSTILSPESFVSVRLGEVLELLIEASRTNHTFMDDFADDEIQLPGDFYDVLMAFQCVRRSA